MTQQLDLFGAPAEEHELPPELLEPPACVTGHGPEFICGSCEGAPFGEDSSGFVHLSECRGRHPLRPCLHCRRLTTPGRWNHADWYSCIDCYPLGTLSAHGAARSPDEYARLHAPTKKRCTRSLG